ncbi:MAG: hypothetical protein ACK40G_01455 [Cytophagaceae bacterium]
MKLIISDNFYRILPVLKNEKMIRKLSLCLIFIILICSFVQAQQCKLNKLSELSDPLKEISGLIFVNNKLFAVNDGNIPNFYVLDTITGKILQTIIIKDITVTDIEALSSDGKFLYLGDVGNNEGDRRDLKIIKVEIAKIGQKKEETITGEVIKFKYPEQTSFTPDKKGNLFDCEAMVVHKDSIYLFTKRIADHQTSLYSLPKTKGDFSAKLIATFNSGGRITEAAMTNDKSKLVLLGYQKKHQFPFLIIFENFKGSNFFTGQMKRIQLTEEESNWQTEGIAFKDNNTFFVSCERTKDFNCSLYKGSLLRLK